MRLIFLMAMLALGGCDSSKDKFDLTEAEVALSAATGDAAAGRPVDRAKLEALPGLDAALQANAQDIRDFVRSQLRDPDSARWGEVWTVDLIHYCGEVNARNGFGGYTGMQPFISADGVSARLPGSPLWKAEDLRHCVGARRVILPADE